MNKNESALKKEVLSGRPVLLFTKGRSMFPLLETGVTRVLVVHTKEALQKNDLPLYKRSDGQCVIHRIIKIKEDGYYTRGDNCRGLERVPRENVLGTVTEIHRKGEIFPVTNGWYKIYVQTWNLIYPIRWLVYSVRDYGRKVWRVAKRLQ